MGDPRKLRKKYSGPSHPWNKERIDDEKILQKEFGFKNKKELWKSSTLLTTFGKQAKKLTILKSEQANIEKKQLLDRLHNMGLLNKGAQLEDVLTITLRNVLERRLQALVLKQGLARSINQARQFITHNHVTVDGKVITSPSYLISIGEENRIAFSAKSELSSADHPERAVEVKKSESKTSKPTEKSSEKEKKVTKKND